MFIISLKYEQLIVSFHLKFSLPVSNTNRKRPKEFHPSRPQRQLDLAQIIPTTPTQPRYINMDDEHNLTHIYNTYYLFYDFLHYFI